ncbi:hypothetical protein BH23ACT9_BH23ACT9_01150 [soil metagenome]
MTYEFACGDVMPGCAATFTASDKEALFDDVAAHADAEHDIKEITPEIASAVEGKIRTS